MTSASVICFLFSACLPTTSCTTLTNIPFISLVSILPDLYFYPISNSYLSSFIKNFKYVYDTSISKSAPCLICSYLVPLPPLYPYFLIFFSISSLLSVKYILEFGTEADIFPQTPSKDGKNFEYSPAGFGTFNLPQTSLVIRKYGSWSIPQGIRQGMFLFPKI